jgi:hypothetical protein
MSTIQSVDFFKRFKDDLHGPCLEIGSLIEPSYVQYLPKDIHEGNVPEQYVGIDIFPGEGVDHVVNLCKEGSIDTLPIKKYRTIQCHYVMEHVLDIYAMAKNIEKLLETDGVFLISVPFSWRIHRIPSDMWRFTPESLDYLFPNIEFIDERSALSVRKGNTYFSIRELPFPEFDLGSGLNKYPWYISWYIKALRKLGLHHNVFNQRALLYETNLMMYGIKRDRPVYNYLNPNSVAMM